MAKPKANSKTKSNKGNRTPEKRIPEDRIEDLKKRAAELSGGQMKVADPLDDYAVETEEAFWNYIVDYEEAPWTTHAQQLADAGVTFPAPDSLKDEELTAKLWELIQKLALLHVFIEQTDHLSDRELYTYLLNNCLREETKAMPLAANFACHIQLLSSGSDEDNFLYLKYYADDDWREQWHKDWPNDPIPEHEDPPYDRDRLLPKHDHSAAGDQEPN